MESKIIAFGDIHGCFQAAETAIALAEKFQCRAVFLGDFVDRGPSSIKTLHTLMDAKLRHPDWIFLRGNHDQMLLDLIDRRFLPQDQAELKSGGYFSYLQSRASYEEWKSLELQQQMEVKIFLDTTLHFYESQHFIFLHSVLRDTQQTLDCKSSEELLWNYEYEPYWEAKPFVHGHLPVVEVEFTYRGININTGCGYRDGYLTGLILEDEKINHNYIKISPNGGGCRTRYVLYLV